MQRHDWSWLCCEGNHFNQHEMPFRSGIICSTYIRSMLNIVTPCTHFIWHPVLKRHRLSSPRTRKWRTRTIPWKTSNCLYGIHEYEFHLRRGAKKDADESCSSYKSASCSLFSVRPRCRWGLYHLKGMSWGTNFASPIWFRSMTLFSRCFSPQAWFTVGQSRSV